MRIWSLHPTYLDTKGLVALWRETLLAKNVLLGNTKGYKNHPQLNRFKSTEDPVAVIDFYLMAVYEEATNRSYNFNKEKISWHKNKFQLPVNTGQLEYEKKHLLTKLRIRDPEKEKMLIAERTPLLHPLFVAKEGVIESWEIL